MMQADTLDALRTRRRDLLQHGAALSAKSIALAESIIAELRARPALSETARQLLASAERVRASSLENKARFARDLARLA